MQINMRVMATGVSLEKNTKIHEHISGNTMHTNSINFRFLAHIHTTHTQTQHTHTHTL
jgi:hypothetical protein